MNAISPISLSPAGSRVYRVFATPATRTMVLFGFGSGLPFTLLTSLTLMTWLRKEGLDLAAIGLISYAGFFYVLKPLWAPLLDRYSLPFFTRLGHRRGWLLAAQWLLIAALIGMAITGPAASLAVFLALLAVGAFAGATQDTVVDAYRIEIAPQEAQAALAAAYSLGYRIALYASGAGALYVAEFQGWSVAYLTMAGLMLVPVAATLSSAEPSAHDRTAARGTGLLDAYVKPFQEFFARNGWRVALALLAFVGLFKFPDQVIGVLAGPFYLDCGYTLADIATVSKLYGVWIGLAGAFLGGVCVAAWGIRGMLLLATVVVAASNAAYLSMAQFPAQLWAFFAAITADNLSQGFAGTVLVAFMAGLTHRHFTATQYALMVSLANLPGKLVGGVSGLLVAGGNLYYPTLQSNTAFPFVSVRGVPFAHFDGMGYSSFFILSALTVIPALLLLAWLWPKLEAEKGFSGA